jgi:hypothetical protein
MANMYVNAMTDLWNTSGTVYSAIKMNVTNAASAAGSMLLDLRVGNVPKYTVDRDGNIFAAGTIATIGIVTSGASTPSTDDSASLGVSGTGWSDLFLAGGGVVNFGAGDATISHATNLLAFGGAANGYSFDAKVIPLLNNTTQLGALGTAWADIFLGDGAVIDFNADVQITHAAANTLAFTGASSGYTFDAALRPLTHGVQALGISGTAWSSLFLASGGIIDFNAGDVTITHAAEMITVGGGDLRVTTAGTNAASVVTVGGTQTLTAKTLDAPIITGSVTGALAVSGNISTPGTITGSTSITSPIHQSDGATLTLATTGAGTLRLRPNGAASAVGQVSINAAGDLTAGANIEAVGTSAMLKIKPSGATNGHIWWYAADGVTTRMILYTTAGAQGAGNLTVGAQNFIFESNGEFNAPSTVFAGGAYFQTNGNVVGPVGSSIWLNIGAQDAYTAIVNRIEARCAAFTNGCVQNWRMMGYIEYEHTSGTIGVRATYGAYVIVMSMRVNSDNYLFGFRQPQLWSPTHGWFAPFSY